MESSDAAGLLEEQVALGRYRLLLLAKIGANIQSTRWLKVVENSHVVLLQR